MAAVTGQQRYRVLERLASGGMAEVYLAESAGLEGFKKKVAIKRVLPHLSEKKRFIAMFLDEARLSAQFNHSNVAHVFDIGAGDNAYFIVMEYVEGSDLKHVMTHLLEQGRGFPLEAAVYIASKICEGLAYAHELTGHDGRPLHAVHRDISPPNVLISKHGEVKIVDFGLAKASSQLEKSEAGIVKGKFSYLAPEAANGLEVDARADIFAVGIILWEMLAGRKLFQGKNDYETVKIVQVAEVPPIGSIHPEANDPQLQTILARALARDRDRRYGSARELGRDLTRLLFRLGRPVDASDIAQLVRAAKNESEEPPASEGMALIDQLIDETLLRFTSLRDRQREAGDSVSMPLTRGTPSLELDRLESWSGAHARPDQSRAAQLVRSTLPAGAFEDGNLAALEDADVPNHRVSLTSRPEAFGIDEQTTRMDAQGARALLERAKGAAPQPANGDEGASSMAGVSIPPPPASRALRAVFVVLILAGVAAAVWFSGLL